MEDTPLSCPKCKGEIKETFYFCPTCGKKLKESPVSTGFWPQIKLYLISLLVPPFGMGLTIRYMKAENQKAKIIGLISLVLTILALVYITWYSVNLVNEFNRQFSTQMGKYQQGVGFY